MEVKDILKLIDQDIEYTKKFISQPEKEFFEKNKPYHWRISGMESLKKKIQKLNEEKKK